VSGAEPQPLAPSPQGSKGTFGWDGGNMTDCFRLFEFWSFTYKCSAYQLLLKWHRNGQLVLYGVISCSLKKMLGCFNPIWGKILYGKTQRLG